MDPLSNQQWRNGRRLTKKQLDIEYHGVYSHHIPPWMQELCPDTPGTAVLCWGEGGDSLVLWKMRSEKSSMEKPRAMQGIQNVA